VVGLPTGSVIIRKADRLGNHRKGMLRRFFTRISRAGRLTGSSDCWQAELKRQTSGEQRERETRKRFESAYTIKQSRAADGKFGLLAGRTETSDIRRATRTRKNRRKNR